MKRVVITGIGAISPIGNDIETIINNVKQGNHGIDKITSYPLRDDAEVTLGAEVKGFDALKYFEKKELKRTDLFCQYAVAAATEAIADCGTDFKGVDPFRVACIIGSGIGGFNTFENEHSKYVEKGAGRVSAFFIPSMIINMATGMVSMRFGFKGINYSPVTACASSTHAIGESFRAIKHGYCDVAVTGGAEATITDFAMAGFNNMRALSRSTDKDRASIPFDQERNGFVMGEGGAILVLEELEHAKKRGAKIYAEIVGYGATGDAYHITSPSPEGEGASKAMELAYQEAGINHTEVNYINAHGTSTGLNDKYETIAIKSAFKEHAKDLYVSSTKSMTGHLLGAAGGMEAIICAKALQEGFVPPTIGYKTPDPDCDLNYVTEGVINQPLNYALSNSLGFGGHNASLCFKKYE